MQVKNKYVFFQRIYKRKEKDRCLSQKPVIGLGQRSGSLKYQYLQTKTRLIIKNTGISFLAMSLKKVYDQLVKIDKVIQEKYNTKMVRIIEEMVLWMCEKSPLLNAMNSKTFYTGSHWDDLQVGTSRQAA